MLTFFQIAASAQTNDSVDEGAPSAQTNNSVDEESSEDTFGRVHYKTDQSSGSLISKAARSGSSVVISSEDEEGTTTIPIVPKTDTYTVQKGDTLWNISQRLFGDSYVWPRIWSYNPNITNPNWIYPGDILNLTSNLSAQGTIQAQSVVSDDVVPTGSKNVVFEQSHGFVDKETLKKAGELVGAHKEVMWLSQHDEAYVEFPKEPVKVGDRFSVFSVLSEVKSVDDRGKKIGKLVRINGLIRVISFDPKTKIARVIIEENTVPIERGMQVGPVHRVFDMIPAIRNQKTVEGSIVAFLELGTIAAAHHVVFIDRGFKDGVKQGNRFFAVEQRDGLRRINNKPNDREGYPVEVIAEIRVIETKPNTSTCLITSSIREIEIGQKVEMRKGY